MIMVYALRRLFESKLTSESKASEEDRTEVEVVESEGPA
jgi:hypothetical protein